LTAATITDGLVFREHYRAENVRSTDALKRLRPMPINPKDVGELERALNDAAGKASILWTAFITFELYLAIAFGSVKHRDLFLETPIKLPVLDVNLPLVGFFVVAPTILLIFHFYVFLQLLALTAKAKDYDALLSQATSDISDQNYLRQRLDSFLILQMLVGPTEQRTGFGGLSLRLIAWITLVGTPVLILLQGQVTFLPYHREWVLWLLRVAVLIDLAVIWYFWKRVRSSNEPMVARVPGKSWPIVGAAASVCVFLLSIGIATFPGERQDHVPAIRLIPTNWRPHWSKKDNWTSLHELLFAGAVDEVSGQPRSLFSNRLVLIDQSFVDPDKLVANEITHSYRGRDFSHAVFIRADLRKADFTGAMLNGASFQSSKLQRAHFGCAERGTRTDTKTDHREAAERRWPDDGCTWLQGASLDFAQLQGASLNAAQLQGASLDRTRLLGASIAYAGVWRVRGAPEIDLTDRDGVDPGTKPWEPRFGSPSSFSVWRDGILKAIPAGEYRDRASERLSALDPTPENEPKNSINSEFWKNASSVPSQSKESIVAVLTDLACSSYEAPYFGRGLLRTARMDVTGEVEAWVKARRSQIGAVAASLRKHKFDQAACLGVKNFTDEDWGSVEELVAAAGKLAPDEKTK
jgi:Pentapeptide repeats (8 copies)